MNTVTGGTFPSVVDFPDRLIPKVKADQSVSFAPRGTSTQDSYKAKKSIRPSRVTQVDFSIR